MSVRRVLVVGSGAREHALAWRLSRDPASPEVWVAPGNPGIARKFPCLSIEPTQFEAIAAAAIEHEVDLVVVGPEAPLADGLADALARHRVTVFGPTGEAARLESSKWFAKQVMSEAGIPTARSEPYQDPEQARSALASLAPPWVIKADGLAAGKGVRVTTDREEAEAFLDHCLSGGPGGSTRRVLIEEFLAGEEASVMAVCDGNRARILPAARDYKRALDGDRGANTGGMGAFAPHPLVDAGLEGEIDRRIVTPVLARMRARGTPFRGLLYCGLMLGADGPRVIEFNVRFGDPEAQAVLPLVEGSLGDLLAGAARGELDPDSVSRGPGATVAISLTDAHYPAGPSACGTIVGLERLSRLPHVEVFHAAAEPSAEGWRLTGGRAATVTARGRDLADARAAAYRAVGELGGSGWRARRDIAGAVAAGAAAGSVVKGGG